MSYSVVGAATGREGRQRFAPRGRFEAVPVDANHLNVSRRGGHVAIVSRIEGGRVFVWNPSPRGRVGKR